MLTSILGPIFSLMISLPWLSPAAEAKDRRYDSFKARACQESLAQIRSNLSIKLQRIFDVDNGAKIHEDWLKQLLNESQSPTCDSLERLNSANEFLSNWPEFKKHLQQKLDDRNQRTSEILENVKMLNQAEFRRFIGYAQACDRWVITNQVTADYCLAELSARHPELFASYQDAVESGEIVEMVHRGLGAEIGVECLDQSFGQLIWSKWDQMKALIANYIELEQGREEAQRQFNAQMDQIHLSYKSRVRLALEGLKGLKCRDRQAEMAALEDQMLFRLEEAGYEENWGTGFIIKRKLSDQRDEQLLVTAEHVAFFANQAPRPLQIANRKLNLVFSVEPELYNAGADIAFHRISLPQTKAARLVPFGKVPRIGEILYMSGFPATSGKKILTLICEMAGFAPGLFNPEAEERPHGLTYLATCRGPKEVIRGMSGGPVFDQDGQVLGVAIAHGLDSQFVLVSPISEDENGRIQTGAKEPFLTDHCYPSFSLAQAQRCQIIPGIGFGDGP